MEGGCAIWMTLLRYSYTTSKCGHAGHSFLVCPYRTTVSWLPAPVNFLKPPSAPVEDSWRQWCWGVQRHQIVRSEKPLKSLKTVSAFKVCRSSSTQRNGIAILYQSGCPSPIYMVSLVWHSLGVRKMVGNQAPLWWWSENNGCLWHTFREKLSFVLLDTEQKSSTAAYCELGENKKVRWMSWKLFVPFENVLSSRLVTYLLFSPPRRRLIQV